MLLQPSGLAALRALDLLEPALAFGARIDRLDGRDLGGRRPMNMAYSSWRAGGFGLGVHRASLFKLLHDAVSACGIEVRTGAEIVSFDRLHSPTLTDAVGRTHGPFDLVVVADGSASRLRASLRPSARAPLYPWGAVWANAVDTDNRFTGALSQRYDRASVMMGVLPIGAGPDGERNLVSLFWSLPRAEIDGFFSGDFAAWRTHASAVWPQTETLLAQFAGPETFSRAVYRDVSVGRWNAGGFIVVGDASHGTSPQLGQGANLGLIDAVELAERVDAPAKLGAYQRARRLQTAPYQLMSRALTPLFQSHGWLGPVVRRWLFAPLAQAPGLRRIAATVLTGVFRLGPTPAKLRP